MVQVLWADGYTHGHIALYLQIVKNFKLYSSANKVCFQMFFILILTLVDGILSKEFVATVQKKYVVKTALKTTDQTDGNDYMNMVPDAGQSVQVGSSIDLKCSASEQISNCYFFRPDGLERYQIKKGSTYNQGRLKCLCDVRFKLLTNPKTKSKVTVQV